MKSSLKIFSSFKIKTNQSQRSSERGEEDREGRHGLEKEF
jgi:hypothetical protein